MSTANMPNAGDLVGNYRLLKPLAVGGAGVIFKAYEEMLDRSVALKFLSSQWAADHEYVQEFFHEARALAKLNHPNIIQVYTVGRHNDIPYFGMELVEGEDLHSYVQKHGPFQVPDALKLIRQAAVGLQHAHKHGLIHRDVKPANLMLTATGVIKLTDFGLAKNVQLAHAATGGFAGTPEYTSPEEAQRKPVDHRTDIYSLGATLFYLLAGRPPFMGNTPEGILQQHIQYALPPIQQFRPNIPLTVNQVLLKMMAKQPGERYQTCDQFIRVLDQLLSGRTTPQPAPAAQPGAGPVEAPKKPKQKNPVLSFVITGVALILTLYISWYVRKNVGTESETPPPVASPISEAFEGRAQETFARLKEEADSNLTDSNYNDAVAVYKRWPANEFTGTKANLAVAAERNRLTGLAYQVWIDSKATALELRKQKRTLEAITLYEKSIRTFSVFPEICSEAQRLIAAANSELAAQEAEADKLRQLLTGTESSLLTLDFEKVQQEIQRLWDTQPEGMHHVIEPAKTEVDRLVSLKKAVIERIPNRVGEVMTWTLANGKVEGRLVKANTDTVTVRTKIGEFGSAETVIRWNELQPASAVQLFMAYHNPRTSDEVLAFGILQFHYAIHHLLPAAEARETFQSIIVIAPKKKPLVDPYLKRLDELTNR